MLKQYGVRTNEIDKEDFLKVAILNQSKEERSPFAEHPVNSLRSAESKQKWNA